MAQAFAWSAAAVGSLGSVLSASAATVLYDSFDRPTFLNPPPATNAWTVQTYNKSNSKGVYGRMPGSIDNGLAFRYGVQAYSPTDIKETNTVITTPSSFALPTVADAYTEFAASIKINWSSANQPGLVFGLSAYGTNAAGQEDAVNMEFVTEQINTGTATSVAYDRIDLTSFNDHTTANPHRWYSQVESGTNATNAYHAYAMRVFTDHVDYLVDGVIFATNDQIVPTGTNLKLVLVAWAPDANWASAEATLPDVGFWYMDVNWVKISTGTTATPTPEPASLSLLGLAAAGLLRRRRIPHGR